AIDNRRWHERFRFRRKIHGHPSSLPIDGTEQSLFGRWLHRTASYVMGEHTDANAALENTHTSPHHAFLLCASDYWFRGNGSISGSISKPPSISPSDLASSSMSTFIDAAKSSICPRVAMLRSTHLLATGVSPLMRSARCSSGMPVINPHMTA